MIPATGVDRGFRKEFRLRKTDEFSSVFAFRRSLRGENFEFLYRPALESSARLGIVVAKKFVRSAVCRNLIKRIVRESFRQVRSTLPPRNIVVRIVANLHVPDRKALRTEVDRLFFELIP